MFKTCPGLPNPSKLRSDTPWVYSNTSVTLLKHPNLKSKLEHHAADATHCLLPKKAYIPRSFHSTRNQLDVFPLASMNNWIPQPPHYMSADTLIPTLCCASIFPPYSRNFFWHFQLTLPPMDTIQKHKVQAD